jgi:2,3-bisphosphoglycerate-dependent phosphoglycerate mutase
MYKLLLFALSFVFISCNDKIPMVVKITKNGVLTNENTTIPIVGLSDDKTIIFIFVRHAEKNTEPKDNPALTPEGKARAEYLAQLLKEIEVYRVAATNTTRALQTAQPLIDLTHCATDTYSKSAAEAFLLSTIQGYKGKIVLVVGHGNTVPDMLNLLSGEKKYEDINEDEYDNIYIASVIEKGNAKIVHYKY